ncbi:MAG: ATP-binding protein [Victivallaceae bacterium]
MITRHLGTIIQKAATQYPVVAVTGPRQSGKTTLCRALFPGYDYVNLEKPDVRQFAQEDPNSFLAQFKNPVILDEVQRTPELFSYIMPIVDERRQMGEFILTGSQNFQLMESIAQSLAGRCATFKLLPLSISELAGKSNLDVLKLAGSEVVAPGGMDCYEQLFKGGFPPLYDRGLEPSDWLAQYTQTYLERDVRTLLNVGNLETFERFLRLCAGRSGQVLNIASLADDAGVSSVTAKRWLSLLKASFSITLFRPHLRNFNKRLVKSPKLYFYDTGLLCYLLGIRSAAELRVHSLRGAIFETYVVSELTKACFNAGIEPPLYYWRDSQGHEIDIIVENGEKLFPIEIKSGQTVASSMFNVLNWWQDLTGVKGGMLIHGGDSGYTRNGIEVRPWFFV